jgi:hypothetical protein
MTLVINLLLLALEIWFLACAHAFSIGVSYNPGNIAHLQQPS